jgi:hypothetical protein
VRPIRCVAQLVAALGFSLLPGANAGAQDSAIQLCAAVLPPGTDMIRLKTGSVLLGRLKTAERGFLLFDIAGIGDTEIKLREVAQIQAPSADFQVDIDGGRRTTGKISEAFASGEFSVSGLDSDTAFLLTDIVRLKRVEVSLIAECARRSTLNASSAFPRNCPT